MKSQKKNIRLLSLTELKEWLSSKNEKPFRAKQIYQWLWQKGVHSFDEMTNLSKPLRTLIEKHFFIPILKIDAIQVSKDRTIKTRFRLHDGNLVEGVLIPTKERMTACVSSQVGCSLTCKFCATGKMKRVRNLTPGEIFDQVFLIAQQAEENYGIPLSNVVYMGMGEPLLNYNNVMQSVEHISSPEGMNFSPRRITVSTAGINKIIRKMADDGARFNLALSLHAADDKKRNKIMPINEQNSLTALSEALQYFFEKNKRWLFIEYILFDKFNDAEEDAHLLADFCKPFPCKVNLIEYNPVEGTGLKKAKQEKLDQFLKILIARGVRATYRRSRGRDIDAACGQLANKGK